MSVKDQIKNPVRKLLRLEKIMGRMDFACEEMGVSKTAWWRWKTNTRRMKEGHVKLLDFLLEKYENVEEKPRVNVF